ncbi:ribonuclease H-like domain-containing protein [Candidatus Woesearchaeota archaeon]|nr:ribonuclease H-like domain-containing protein [Candidatus Woesearchaeota archaeon]
MHSSPPATFKFLLLDITYKVINGKALIYLYGSNENHEPICLIDHNFPPYFFVLASEKQKDEVLAIMASEGRESYRMTAAEPLQMQRNQHPVDCLRVEANLPSGVPHLAAAIREKLKLDAMEADIRFVRRYAFDKHLQFLSWYTIDAKPELEHLRIPAYDLLSMKLLEDEHQQHDRNVLAFDIETYAPSKEILPEKNPVLMFALYGKNVKKVVTWKKGHCKADFVELVKDESALLRRFQELLLELKPTILVGYYSDGFDLPYLLTRAKANNVNFDLGADYSSIVLGRGAEKEAKIEGLVHVDLLRFLRGVMHPTLATDSLRLEHVAQEMLGKGKVKVALDQLSNAWDSHPDDLEEFFHYNLQDAQLVYELYFLIEPTMQEMAKLTCLPLFEVVRSRYSTFVEAFLISRAREADELVPPRPNHDETEERSGKKYQGAFVYEPIPGIYHNLAVFDFRSLYPTILTSHNVSPGTLNCSCCKHGKNKVPDKPLWYCTKKRGFIPHVIEDIIERRMRIKTLLKKQKDQLLEARSFVLKTLANSIYGYYGFSGARWYCFECADSITAFGRHYILSVIDDAKKEGFQVLYSDTDSIFLGLGKKTKEHAHNFLEQINRRLPGQMELELEDFYPAGIFVSIKASETGAKKKYALMNEKGKIKIRGFEAIRRNSSELAREVQLKVLEIILKDQKPEQAIAYVQQMVEDVQAKKIPVAKMVLSTQLTKDLRSYSSRGPHVAVAERMEQQGIPVRAGTTIRYVITPGKGIIRERAKQAEEVKEGEYDPDYYIHHQILPAVEQILDVLGYNLKKEASRKEHSLEKWFG